MKYPACSFPITCAFVFEDLNDGLKICSIVRGVFGGHRLKHFPYAIEFCVHLCLDLNGPGDLIYGADHPMFFRSCEDPPSFSHAATASSIVYLTSIGEL